jgi:gamma-glutamylaminecyclotransferase
MSRLFIYGTLKRGGRSHTRIARHRFLGLACTTPDYLLYRLDGYPGLVADASATVGIQGELWEVDAAGLAELDAFEGLTEGLYRREPVTLSDPAGHPPVDAYLYARSVIGRALVGPVWTETR